MSMRSFIIILLRDQQLDMRTLLASDDGELVKTREENLPLILAKSTKRSDFFPNSHNTMTSNGYNRCTPNIDFIVNMYPNIGVSI
jgi:hypothetical protein